jgi:hypothetical protein
MADINLTEITNVGGTGVFDKLMESVGKQLEDQYLNNRITSTDYANVYLGSMQAVLQQSVQYALQEQLIEAQIGGILADNLLKAKQLEIAQQELAIKQYELSTTLPAQVLQVQAQTAEITDSTVRANTELTDQLLSTANDRDIKTRGMVDQEATGAAQRISMAKDDLIKDEQRIKVQEEVDLLQTQDLSAVYEKDYILPANLSQIIAQTDSITREITEREAMGTKQRLILDKDIALKEYENTVLQVDQHDTNLKQQALLDTEEQSKQYEVDNLMPAQLAQTQKQIEVAENQKQNLYADRVLKDKQTAKLGLDNVMKNSEHQKAIDSSYVYLPKYEQGQ